MLYLPGVPTSLAHEFSKKNLSKSQKTRKNLSKFVYFLAMQCKLPNFFDKKCQTFLDIFFFVERYPGFGVHYNIDLLPLLLSNLKYFIGILPRSTTLQPDTFCRILTIPSMGKYQKEKKTCRHLCLFECYNFYLIVGSEQKK